MLPRLGRPARRRRTCRARWSCSSSFVPTRWPIRREFDARPAAHHAPPASNGARGSSAMKVLIGMAAALFTAAASAQVPDFIPGIFCDREADLLAIVAAAEL